MLTLYIQAPFAVFRYFTAGWYRPTASFLTPSAAYGLILNLAGIESRRDDGDSVMTVTAYDLPTVEIAIGADPENPDGVYPPIQSIFQQLHNYLEANQKKEVLERVKGNKYNITPVRREFLSNLRAYILLKSSPELENRVRQGLQGTLDAPRYGLPFLGDNSFLVDKIEIIDDAPVNAHWYTAIVDDEDSMIRPHTARLTSWIDRQEMSKTRTGLFAPDLNACSSDDVPAAAWVSIEPPVAPPVPQESATKKSRSKQPKQAESTSQSPESSKFQLKQDVEPELHQKGLFDDD